MTHFVPICRYAVGLILLISLSAAAMAQGETVVLTDDSTPPGAASGSPAGSFALSGFDNVNPYNGHLNFHLPLMKIGGRGSAGYTMMLPIEQKWLVDYTYIPLHNQDFYSPNPYWWTGAEPGFGPGTVFRRSGGSLETYACLSDGYRSRFFWTWTRLTVTLPDGTEYELRDKLSNGKPAETETPVGSCVSTAFNRGKEFVTADGSSATFVSDEDILDPIYADPISPSPVSGYLYMRDGTRYRVGSGAVTEIRDRNGNTVMFDGPTATDSLGRQVTIQSVTNDPQYGTGTRISYGGFGGAARSVFITKANLGDALRGDQSLKTYNQLFGIGSATTNFETEVTKYVWLPNGEKYRFFYNSYGELARVELPTGGAFEYDYLGGLTDGPNSGLIQVGIIEGYNAPNLQVYRRVVERRVYKNKTDAVPESTTTFSRPESYGPGYFDNDINTVGYVEVVQRAGGATGTILAGARHYYYGGAAASMDQRPGGFAEWREGREHKTEVFDTNGTQLTNVLRKVEQEWRQRGPVSWWSWWVGTSQGYGEEPPNDPRVVTTVTSVEPYTGGANLIAKATSVDPQDQTGQTVGFDQYNNQTDAWVYDFGQGAVGAFVRRTHTDYLSSTNYTSATAGAHLRGLPTEQWVSTDIAGTNKASRVTYAYDQSALTPRMSITGHDVGFTTGYLTRGNVTGTTRYANAAAGTGAVTSTSVYDIAGNVVSATDPKGNTSQIGYADSFCNGSTCGGTFTSNTFAFPTSSTSPVPDPSGQHGSNTALVTSTVYDFYTGLTYSATDANNKTTTLSYANAAGTQDPLDRLKSVTRPDGSQAEFNYGDTPGNLYVQTLSDLDAARQTNSYQYFDGLGRSFRSIQYENQDTTKPWITVDTEYDALGRVKRASLPYRAAAGASMFSTDKWAENTYDALGRALALKTKPDNAVVTTDYSGNKVLVTDQAGKKRMSSTDALGRMTDVWEITPADAATVTVAFQGTNYAAYATGYIYDALGNLRKVDQGGQLRFFMYDSLGRLIRAKNPEQGNLTPDLSDFPAMTDSTSGTTNSQWSVGYLYDDNGNLLKRKDARDVVASYSYDALNRNKTVTYAATPSTPNVSRFYDNDASGANGLGRLYKTESAATAQTKFTAYDAMGQPTHYEQRFWVNNIWGQAYPVQHGYNKAGGITSVTYPSQRTVNYNYDAAGRIGDNGAATAFNGNLGDGTSRTYASEIRYQEMGGMEQERFGTDTPVYNKRFFNSRGQMNEIRVSTYSITASGQQTNWNRGAILNVYSANPSDGWTASGTDNNGNLRKQMLYVPDATGSWDTSFIYDYDALNRLDTSREVRAGNNYWVQDFDYDRWGNRTINATGTTGTTGGTPPPEPQFSVSTATNRLGVPTGSRDRWFTTRRAT